MISSLFITEIHDGTFKASLHGINLDDYSEEETLLCVNGYYNSVLEIVEIYEEDANQVIAECISECQRFDEDSKTLKSIAEINAWLATIDVNLAVE